MSYRILLSILFITFSFSQDIITFNNCGQEGKYGPSQGQCDNEYGSGVVIVNEGIQEWTVPSTDEYTVEAFGAKGSNSSGQVGGDNWIGGNGARMKGVLNLIPAEVNDLTGFPN